MRIFYPPSEKTLRKIEVIRTLHEKGLTGNKIAPIVNLSRRYVYALLEWDRENRKENKV